MTQIGGNMLKPGMMIGDRYEIIETVGAGGMSVVYKAKCHKLNRYVAIKVLKPEFSDDKNFVTKFRVEAQSAAGLSHPNIVNVYDVGEDDGIYYIVMELVEGITLKEYIQRNGRLDIDKAIDFSIQIASGIETAHNNHTIHRDIKPQNIIVSKSGTVKVTDFGIARAATSNTIASNAMGSVHYISPEQARGGYSDERSDIYSLGITMYEMVTGRVPFEGDNNVTVALMHIQGEMIPPREYYPDIPVGFEKIILKCTQKKQERRYLTASALIADLKKIAVDKNADISLPGATVPDSETRAMTPRELEEIKQDTATKAPEKELEVFPVSEPRRTEIERRPEQESRELKLNKEDKINKDEYNYQIDADEEDDEEPATNAEGEVMDDDLDPKLQKFVIIFGIIGAVLVIMFFMFMIGRTAGWFKFNGGTTETTTTEEVTSGEMPSVVGLTLTKANKAITDAGLVPDIVYENSNDVEKDYVISQEIAAKTMVTKGEKVKIVVSAGTEETTVPNVVGYEDSRATTLIREAGFEVGHSYEYSEDVDKDKVISQSPEEGTKAPAGSKIIITVSNGEEIVNVVVPTLLNSTKAEAESKLNAVGLTIGSVSEEYSENYPEGKVIGQSYSANTEIKKGTAVDITISKGSKPVEVTSYKVSVQAFNVTIPKGKDSEGNPATVSGTIQVYLKYNDGTVVTKDITSYASTSGQTYESDANVPITISNFTLDKKVDATVIANFIDKNGNTYVLREDIPATVSE